jgi:hypothetical protein
MPSASAASLFVNESRGTPRGADDRFARARTLTPEAVVPLVHRLEG